MGKLIEGKFRKPPYYKRNPTDIMSSMWWQQMNSEQKGWFNTMMDRQWDSPNCLLVNSADTLPLYAGVNPNGGLIDVVVENGVERKRTEMERFTEIGWIVLQRFQTTPDGKYIFNARLLDEYEEFLASRLDARSAGLASAKSLTSEQRSERARKAAETRWLHANRDANGMLTDANQTETETETRDKRLETEKPPCGESAKSAASPGPKKQSKPKTAKPEKVDERFVPFIAAIDAYWKFKNKTIPLTWDASEGKKLNALLDAQGNLTLEQFRDCLNHRARSDVVHSERPRVWIENVISYANGPLDRYGKPFGGNGHDQSKPQVNYIDVRTLLKDRAPLPTRGGEPEGLS